MEVPFPALPKQWLILCTYTYQQLMYPNGGTVPGPAQAVAYTMDVYCINNKCSLMEVPFPAPPKQWRMHCTFTVSTINVPKWRYPVRPRPSSGLSYVHLPYQQLMYPNGGNLDGPAQAVAYPMFLYCINN